MDDLFFAFNKEPDEKLDGDVSQGFGVCDGVTVAMYIVSIVLAMTPHYRHLGTLLIASLGQQTRRVFVAFARLVRSCVCVDSVFFLGSALYGCQMSCPFSLAHVPDFKHFT